MLVLQPAFISFNRPKAFMCKLVLHLAVLNHLHYSSGKIPPLLVYLVLAVIPLHRYSPLAETLRLSISLSSSEMHRLPQPNCNTGQCAPFLLKN